MADERGEEPDEWTISATRKLHSSGGSTVVAIPPNLLQEVRFREGEMVELIADRETSTITIRPTGDED